MVEKSNAHFKEIITCKSSPCCFFSLPSFKSVVKVFERGSQLSSPYGQYGNTQKGCIVVGSRQDMEKDPITFDRLKNQVSLSVEGLSVICIGMVR